jgi:NAD(P)-dependent dehydrogenase (short-subunit alcohol dehydrogenase family)
MTRTALVVGASRGLGLGLTRELLAQDWQVVATERSDSAALHELAETSRGALQIEQLDINDLAQIARLEERLGARALELLFVNAGVCDEPGQTIGQISDEEFDWIFKTNVLGPMRVIERLAPRVPDGGVIAAMSSALGIVGAEQSGGFDAYGASKAALNKLLRIFSKRAGGARSVLAVHPGWVATDMGGSDAPLDVETSVRGIVKVVEGRLGKTGDLFVDYSGAVQPW